jgi:GNAT superfamily N-acetyltransferase
MMSDTTITIFRTTADEWRELRIVRLEALADTPEAFATTYEEATRWSDDHWRQMASLRVFFLAQCDGHTVGMASGGLNDEFPGTKWLYGLYVTPTSRGSGVAASLVEVVGQWARQEGASSLYLMVRSAVPRARAFYEKLDFQPTGAIVVDDQNPTMSMMTMVQNLG